MNILTFDIEEWAIAKASGYGNSELYAEYNNCLEKILSFLKLNNIKATFFCTGAMAKEFPDVVKLIDSNGHEVGCHSYSHRWLNKITYNQAKEDTYSAVVTLEDCIGKKVTSYRAPAFSISDSNTWMFDILAENGITIDSSVFPARRDFGGFPDFQEKKPCLISHNGITIKEFPINVAKFIGIDIPYSGGGYFRLLPSTFICKQMTDFDYTMCYFHINDLRTTFSGVYSREKYEEYFKESGTIINRYGRYFKANVGKKNAMRKFDKLMSRFDFIDISEADRVIDWDLVNHIDIR